ncbi:hypothetical protein ATCC90586_002790 [Pythium insidiosum]|nr:hypothetical protein ATCC90586_002790 [Pythium insidiosum]
MFSGSSTMYTGSRTLHGTTSSTSSTRMGASHRSRRDDRDAPLTAERAMMDQIRAKLEKTQRRLASDNARSMSSSAMSSSRSTRYYPPDYTSSQGPAPAVRSVYLEDLSSSLLESSHHSTSGHLAPPPSYYAPPLDDSQYRSHHRSRHPHEASSSRAGHGQSHRSSRQPPPSSSSGHHHHHHYNYRAPESSSSSHAHRSERERSSRRHGEQLPPSSSRHPSHHGGRPPTSSRHGMPPPSSRGIASRSRGVSHPALSSSGAIVSIPVTARHESRDRHRDHERERPRDRERERERERERDRERERGPPTSVRVPPAPPSTNRGPLKSILQKESRKTSLSPERSDSGEDSEGVGAAAVAAPPPSSRVRFAAVDLICAEAHELQDEEDAELAAATACEPLDDLNGEEFIVDEYMDAAAYVDEEDDYENQDDDDDLFGADKYALRPSLVREVDEEEEEDDDDDTVDADEDSSHAVDDSSDDPAVDAEPSRRRTIPMSPPRSGIDASAMHQWSRMRQRASLTSTAGPPKSDIDVSAFEAMRVTTQHRRTSADAQEAVEKTPEAAPTDEEPQQAEEDRDEHAESQLSAMARSEGLLPTTPLVVEDLATSRDGSDSEPEEPSELLVDEAVDAPPLSYYDDEYVDEEILQRYTLEHGDAQALVHELLHGTDGDADADGDADDAMFHTARTDSPVDSAAPALPASPRETRRAPPPPPPASMSFERESAYAAARASLRASSVTRLSASRQAPATTRPTVSRVPQRSGSGGSAVPRAPKTFGGSVSSAAHASTLSTASSYVPRRLRPKTPLDLRKALPPSIGAFSGLASGPVTFDLDESQFYEMTWSMGEFGFSFQRVYYGHEDENEDANSTASTSPPRRRMFLRMLLNTDRATCPNFRDVRVGDVLIQIGDTRVCDLPVAHHGTGDALTRFFKELTHKTPMRLVFQRMDPMDWEGGVEL